MRWLVSFSVAGLAARRLKCLARAGDAPMLQRLLPTALHQQRATATCALMLPTETVALLLALLRRRRHRVVSGQRRRGAQ